MPSSPLFVKNVFAFQNPYRLIWSLSAAASFQGLMILSSRNISADLHTRDSLLASVVARFIALGFSQDAKKRRVTICRPVPESKPADKNGYSGKKRIEEIEGSNARDTNEVKQSALYTQISERL